MANVLSFEAQVKELVDNTDDKLLAVFRESIQRVVDVAQTPVAKGGRMRVDTGFLRASGMASTNGMPSGPTRNEAGAQFAYSDADVIVTLARMKPGDTFFFGWTAVYAKYREYEDGFLRLAAQQWPTIVNDVVIEANRRSNGR